MAQIKTGQGTVQPSAPGFDVWRFENGGYLLYPCTLGRENRQTV